MFSQVFHCFSHFYAQDRIALVAIFLRAMGKKWIAILLFRSFADKKRAIGMKKQRAISKPI